MRRILNSFLQYLENDDSYSIILAATNNPKLLDKALFRRFDDVLEYKLPDLGQIQCILENHLEGLNHADIVRACEEAIKYSLINDENISKAMILSYIQDRKGLYRFKEA